MPKRCSWIHDHKPWTQQEEDFLRANRGTMTNRAMAAALPGRTPDAVSCRCRQLRLLKRDLRPAPAPVESLSKRFWRASEIAVLHRHARSGPAYIHDWHLPHRTQDAIGMTDDTTTTAAAAAPAADAAPASPPVSDWTPGILPVGVSITADGLSVSMPTTPPAIKGFFEKLVNELEDIPGEVTYELSCAKDKVLAAISYIESHFQSAKTVAETDAAAIKTDATDVQAAVEKAV